jgi:hypothetical protein
VALADEADRFGDTTAPLVAVPGEHEPGLERLDARQRRDRLIGVRRERRDLRAAAPCRY